MKKIKEILKQTCDYALSQGANQCDLLLNRDANLAISPFAGKVDSYKISSSQITGIRVISNKRVGLASTTKTDQQSLKLMVDSALENAKCSASSEHQTIAQMDGELEYTEFFSVDDTTIEKKIELALELEQGVKRLNPQAKLSYCQYFDKQQEQFYYSSFGRSTYEKFNYFAAYVAPLLEQAGKSGTFFSSTVARRFEQLNIKDIIVDSMEMAKLDLMAKPCSTGKYDVIFSIDMLAEMMQAFSSLFSGQSAMEGKNRFAQLMGQEVASSGLGLRDIPCLSTALITKRFDSEGVEAQEVEIIKDGKMNSLLHNQESANFYQISSNGHAMRSPTSRLTVDISNLVIASGVENDLWAGKVLKITRLDGLYSGRNVISGEFSFGASGQLMQAGQLVQPVKGITISGNFFDLLKQIDAIGVQQQLNKDQNFLAPEIRFAQLDIAG